MGGGTWAFLVGGVICLINSVNEQDLCLLNSAANGLPLARASYRDVLLLGGGRKGK